MLVYHGEIVSVIPFFVSIEAGPYAHMLYIMFCCLL